MSLNTTLCYLEQDGKYLMLHRIKKQQDVNHEKWIGVGGKFEQDESPDECILREVQEETGVTLTDYRCRGVLTFVAAPWETEYIYLYTATGWRGTLLDADACREGVLAWVAKEKVTQLPIWPGDRIFLALLAQDAPFFSLKFVYDGDRLVYAAQDGRPLPLPDENL
ncbi:MAG: 8-oxo-dGTP diphosphatase [Faecalibacterium sp.]|jgi:8-oxo-dGTP diphosphatase|nr:8-oxo-dGTP diphosphatase [Faecalibacterium sp.]